MTTSSTTPTCDGANPRPTRRSARRRTARRSAEDWAYDGEEAEDILRLGDDSYEFDGLVLLDEISELLNIEFDEPEEDTIGGFVFGLLGRKPEEGDRVVTGGWRFEVTEAEGFRVTRVKATMLQEDGTAVQADE